MSSLILYLQENFNFENKTKILESIEKHQYSFLPFNLKLIPTKKQKHRKVCILDNDDKCLDKHIFNYLKLFPQLSQNSVHSISLDIKKNIKNGKLYFLRVDIKEFFESLDHLILIEKIKSLGDNELTELIKSFLITPLVFKNNSNELNVSYQKGIPLGSAISQGLSNIYLYSFDKLLNEFAKLNEDAYYRYTDDICYLTSNKDDLNTIRNLIEKELSNLKLTVNSEKSVFGNISESGFNYLGFYHSKEGISLSEDTIYYIKNNITQFYKCVLFYKSLYFSKDEFLRQYYSLKSTNKFWKNLSIKMNSVIRGFSRTWPGSENYKEKVYGLARFISITDDFKQVKLIDQWLRKNNKYYCYKLCENEQLPKTFIELDSLYNWYFRYKKNLAFAIDLAYQKYKLSKESRIVEIDEYFEIKLPKPPIDNSFDDQNENEYIIINEREYLALDDVYYDYDSENWEPIPEDYMLPRLYNFDIS